jgi:cbb3-type cytochrome oxidase subunit 3
MARYCHPWMVMVMVMVMVIVIVIVIVIQNRAAAVKGE